MSLFSCRCPGLDITARCSQLSAENLAEAAERPRVFKRAHLFEKRAAVPCSPFSLPRIGLRSICHAIYFWG